MHVTKQFFSIFTACAILFLLMGAKAIGPELFFSATHTLETNQLTVRATLVLLDDGSYTFESNTGGWSLCGRSGKAGKFKGKIPMDALKNIKKHFKSMKSACNKLKNCIAGRFKKDPSAFWEIIGWGKYSDSFFMIRESSAMPSLTAALTKLEGVLIGKNAKRMGETLALTQEVNKKGDGAQLTLSYEGPGQYPIVVGDKMFLVYGEKGRKPFVNKGKNKTPPRNYILVNGQSRRIYIKYKDYGVVKGDQFTYRPTKVAMNPCIVLK